MKKETKILEKYPNACLETCGDKKHKKGCYIKLRKGKIEDSEELMVILDKDKEGNIIGIDLETGQ